ncbi:MAG: insulinase family protein [Sphingomonadales bacterium]|nr:insulinase family protein [Sphingomonadales bacterium]
MHLYNKFVLKNGLRVIHLQDNTRTTVVLNTLYNVGARDEVSSKTGFAHLFEHLMFAGSENVPVFDKEVEEAGGQNNAFTNNEFTNYYLVMPSENVETAFWLESDRMRALTIDEKSLSVQRGVVVEEFKQRCFNAPFGMLWHHIRSVVYQNSPYQWPTIGLDIKHIEDAVLEDVQSFYNKFYSPQNAVISVVGNIDLQQTQALAEKWFGDIHKPGEANKNHYETDVEITERRFFETEDLSPNPAVFLVWRGPSFSDPTSISLELFAEMLGGSDVSPLQLKLVKETQQLNAAECFYLRGLGEGLFVMYGILNDGVTHQEGEAALLAVLQSEIGRGAELERIYQGVKNRYATQLLFEATQPMQLAQRLCYFENAGSLDDINRENEIIENISLSDVLSVAEKTLNHNIVSVINYHPKS